ncbi:hypothetical protein MYX07_03055, partial [Patescibacteria group bacterium AH-259-L07]|nr:hypothetical protein [Patescibacteria group bacterium AH-259-L07]
CQNCKNQFTIEPEDFDFYEKVKVPAPTWCPDCRFQRRASFRNERRLFHSQSAKSGKDILSLVPPEAELTVYDEKEWWADDWDPLAYGKEYNFSRPFFEQFQELLRKVPRFSRSVTNMINSDYCANAGYLKNCYLLFHSSRSEDCMYGSGVRSSSNCLDNAYVNKCERCYQNFWLTNCHQTHFSVQCEDCIGVWFSKNCRGCTHCFGCVNLRNQKYHIFNQPYSKEEYKKRIADFRFNTWTGLMKAVQESHSFWLRFPNKFMQGIKNTNVSGDYIFNSKNVKHSYLVRESEDLKYVQHFQFPYNKDCYDHTVWGARNELSYECCVCGMGTFHIRFCYDCWTDVRELEYCMYCSSSSYLFGCVGIRKKQYCIFNKQYSRKEYEKRREKIIAHMSDMPYVDKKGRVYRYGEFFPVELTPYGYNNTIAQEYFPLTREQSQARGYPWVEKERSEYAIARQASDLPDAIEDASDTILEEIIACASCGHAYRILPQELAFLRGESIPLPRQCVDCRHSERLDWRNPPKFNHRQCQCAGEKSDNKVYKNTVEHFHKNNHCSNEFETTYAPNRKEIVYCEACYQQEVV